MILERKDFEETGLPPAIMTDEHATYPIGDIILFDFDERTSLRFETNVYDSTPQLPMEARWSIDGELVLAGREVPPDNTGGHTRRYSDTIDATLFASTVTGQCHTLTMWVSHRYYSDTGPGALLQYDPDGPLDIATATWYVVTADASHPPQSCNP